MIFKNLIAGKPQEDSMFIKNQKGKLEKWISNDDNFIPLIISIIDGNDNKIVAGNIKYDSEGKNPEYWFVPSSKDSDCERVCLPLSKINIINDDNIKVITGKCIYSKKELEMTIIRGNLYNQVQNLISVNRSYK